MSDHLHHDPALMRVGEAAEAYRLSRQTIRRHIRNGKLAGVRVGREFRVYADQPDFLLDPSRRGPAPDRQRLR